MQVFLNGSILPIEQAKISPLDRAFLFGDGVYEVIPYFNKKPFELIPHLQRMQRTLDGIELTNPYNYDEWEKLINEVVASAEYSDVALYIQISRGEYTKRDHAYPANTKPTVFIAPLPMSRPTAEMINNGVSVVSTDDKRWFYCQFKTTALLGNVLARNLSAKVGAIETIMFREGFLSEASASNVFVVSNGEILIVPDDNLILRGITYEVVERLAKENNLPHSKRLISKAEVFSADEVWLTSSTKMVLPVTQIDDQKVGNGEVGEVFKNMFKLINDYQQKS